LADNPKSYIDSGNLSITSESNVVVTSALTISDKNHVHCNLINPKSSKRYGINLRKLPNIIHFHDRLEEINSEIILGNENNSEKKFFEFAFFQNYSKKFLAIHSESLKNQFIDNGAERVSDRFSKIIGDNITIKLHHKMVGDDNIITVHLQDSLGYGTPINYRGSGLQKILSILTFLADLDDNEYTIITYDEPENSLHADSQHNLRRFFEDLGSNPHFQVIYATHSPMMLNTFYPNRIRLLRRTKIDEIPQSIIDDDFIDDSFFPIISSLGLSPSDSLLIGPITIILEGKTEVKSFSLLLKKLMEMGINGFEKIDLLMANTLIFNGQGDNFSKWANLVSRQGGNPVVLLDGDKARHKKECQNKGIPGPENIFCLPENIEIEDVIPQEKYFESLIAFYDNQNLNYEDFLSWWVNLDENDKRKNCPLISKKIGWWLDQNEIYHYDKPEIFSSALDKLEISDFKAINEEIIEELRNLVNKCIGILENL